MAFNTVERNRNGNFFLSATVLNYHHVKSNTGKVQLIMAKKQLQLRLEDDKDGRRQKYFFVLLKYQVKCYIEQVDVVLL